MEPVFFRSSAPQALRFARACGLVFLFALLPLFLPLSSAAQSDPGEAADIEATLDQDLSEVKAEADPNLVGAGALSDEAPPPEGSGPEHAGIEEILVTAQKRSTNIQETPTAITALSGAQLFDRGIYDVESLATQIPNFQYGETFGIARITIRGIGNQGFTDPSTAFHIDGIYQNNQTAASALTFYDIAQIEVLRGPQGTLWGRNSTAGAINVSTRGPVHEFEIFGDLLRGSYEQWFGRGVVNVPLLEDKIAFRAAAFFDDRDGYQKNLVYPGTTSQNADDAKNWGIRPQVLFDITDELSLTLRGGYSHQGGVGWANKIEGDYPTTYPFGNGLPIGPIAALPPFIPTALPNAVAYTFLDTFHSDVGGTPMQPNPADPREIRRDVVQFQDISTWDVNGTLEWDFFFPPLGDLTFNVVGSYRKEDRAQNFDGDLSEQDMILASINAATTDRVIDAHLRSSGDTATEWLLGFFMLDADGYLDVDPGTQGGTKLYFGRGQITTFPNRAPGGGICIRDASGGLPDPSCTESPTILELIAFNPLSDFISLNLSGGGGGGSNDTLSLAGYAHIKHKFLEDKFNVGLGLRYSYDRSRARRYSTEVTVLAPGLERLVLPLTVPFQYEPVFAAPDNCIQPGFDTTEEESWDGVTGDLKIEFLPVENHMVYVSVSRGYKPGYINGLAVGLGCDPPPGQPNPFPLGNALDETIWAYEIGSKNRFLDDTLQVNLTGFVYQYDNLQVQDREENTTYIQNAARAQVRGIEFEGIWEPIDDLSLSLVYGYLNARYLDYQGFDFATGQPADFSGNRMIRAPEHTATLAAEYSWELNGKGRIVPRIQYFVSDEIYFNASNSEESREPSYGTLQIRGRWESENDLFFIEGFVENVTDEDVRSTRSVGSGLLGRPITVAYQPPRTWGVRIGGSY